MLKAVMPVTGRGTLRMGWREGRWRGKTRGAAGTLAVYSRDRLIRKTLNNCRRLTRSILPRILMKYLLPAR